MKYIVIKCDSAAVMPDANITNEQVEFTMNNDYKYLSAFPLCEDGSFVAMASKNLKEWAICVGAYLDGELINLNDFAKQVEALSK